MLVPGGCTINKQSQVLSLWLVDDKDVKELMVEYYENLQKGQGRSEAMRQTQLNLLKSKKYSHPYYWGAFVPSGE